MTTPAQSSQAALAPGEIYAGPVLAPDGSTTHHLVLLPQRPEKHLDWQAAMAWAASVGGELPNRQEQGLLFANCKPHLPTAWCWSSEEHAEDASFAWSCYFLNGFQNSDHKSFVCSAVAVRRLILESFDASCLVSSGAATEATSGGLSASQVKAIRARLDRWELSHLRALAAEQAERLDAADARIDALQAEVAQAWRSAESWQEDAMELAGDLQRIGAEVGLTQSGHLVAVAQQAVHAARQGGAA